MNYKNVIDEQIEYLQNKQQGKKGPMEVSAMCEICKTIAELAQIANSLPKQPETK